MRVKEEQRKLLAEEEDEEMQFDQLSKTDELGVPFKHAVPKKRRKAGRKTGGRRKRAKTGRQSQLSQETTVSKTSFHSGRR